MYVKATLRISTGDLRDQYVHVVVEPGGVLDAVQVGRRRSGHHRLRRQPKSRGTTGQFMVAFEAGVRIHVMAKSNPRRAA
ncbi:hypothetical protein [Micromonospora sp. B9E7]|uniref:hypothetical protein n=1 Tax=Micromonospora sp. B9E7 TaxID=3153574 RepID=UPI00325DAC51